MSNVIKIRKIEHINHNVVHIVTDKPSNYNFSPGQATELSINKEGLKDEKRPFTFTSLPEDETLEFTIKIYPSHNGVTEQIEQLKVGDELIIGDPWGAIAYKGTGTFIAGGAGITPFIAIFKDLVRKGLIEGNKLLYSNKEERDIILKQNLQSWLGNALELILSQEEKSAYSQGRIDKAFLEKHQLDVSRPVYLCGPPPMQDSLTETLYEMGLSKSHLITED